MEYSQTSCLSSQYVTYLPCWEQWTKINTWNLIRQPGLHLHPTYWIWIAFQPLCKPLSSFVQKGIYFIVSPTCVGRLLKKKKKKMFGIKFFWNKEKKIQFPLFVWTRPLRDRFRRAEDHQVEICGLKSKHKPFGWCRHRILLLCRWLVRLPERVVFLFFFFFLGTRAKEIRTLDVAGLAVIAHKQITSEERGGGLEGPGRRSSWRNVGRGRSTRSAESGGRSAGGGGGVGGWESCASRPRIHSSAEAEHRQHTPYVNRCWQMQSMLAAALWLALLGREDHNIASVLSHFFGVWLCFNFSKFILCLLSCVGHQLPVWNGSLSTPVIVIVLFPTNLSILLCHYVR